MTTSRDRVLPSVIDAIGGTPAVDLARLTAGLGARIVAKLEYLNPGFSKKDRIARQIVLDALESGALRPGQPVVELTSGNTGTGLAIVCGVLGHPFVAVMSEGNSRERARMMAALGAEVVLVPQAPGSVAGQVSGEDLALVETRARELTVERGAYRADQFGNPSAARAHERTTAQELGPRPAEPSTPSWTYVGTAGTYAGRDHRPQGARPGDPVLPPRTGGCGRPRRQGRHAPRPPASRAVATRWRTCRYCGTSRSTGTSRSPTRRRSTSRAGWRARRASSRGFSSGAVVAAALRLIGEGRVRPGGTVAVLLADSGLKYLSTDLWEA